VCFHTLLQQVKISLASQKQTRKNREGKILPSCPMSLHNEVLKENFSFFLPVSASHSRGERRTVSTSSQAPRSYCSCSAQCPKYQGVWQRLLEAASVQSSVAAEREGSAAHASQQGRTRRHTLTVLSLPLLACKGRKGFLSAAQRGVRGLYLPSVTCIPQLGQGMRAYLLMARRD